MIIDLPSMSVYMQPPINNIPIIAFSYLSAFHFWFAMESNDKKMQLHTTSCVVRFFIDVFFLRFLRFLAQTTTTYILNIIIVNSNHKCALELRDP